MSNFHGMPLRVWLAAADCEENSQLKHSAQLLLKSESINCEDCFHEIMAGLCSRNEKLQLRTLALLPNGRAAMPFLAALQVAAETENQEIAEAVESRLSLFSENEIAEAELPEPYLEGFPLAHWLREAEETVDNQSLADEERASQVLSLIGPEAVNAFEEIVESAQRIEFFQRPIGYYRALAGIGILDDRVLELFVEGLYHPFLASQVAACMGEFGTNGRVLASEALEKFSPAYEDEDDYDDNLQAALQADRWCASALESWASFGQDAQAALHILKEVFRNPDKDSSERVYAAHALPLASLPAI